MTLTIMVPFVQTAIRMAFLLDLLSVTAMVRLWTGPTRALYRTQALLTDNNCNNNTNDHQRRRIPLEDNNFEKPNTSGYRRRESGRFS